MASTRQEAQYGVVERSGGGLTAGIVGRVEERRVLEAAIRGVVGGQPCAVFVHGEAGVGKTRLVRIVCDAAAAEGVAVLWGPCLRFGAVDAPYAPLTCALEGWIDSADHREVSAVLDAVPSVGRLLASLGGTSADDAIRLVSVLDRLVLTIAARRPTVLVVDDVQWADLASRDALTYLVAGFRNQRLAVVATYRDEELSRGHPMHTWLADLRRLPSVTDVRLDRLGRDETEQQISMLLGGPPHRCLVDDVVRLSGGNPYLSELLVQHVTVDAEELPADLPAELSGALLAAWHRLPRPARELMRMLAVAGRPASIRELREVAAARGIGAEALTTALAEATDGGIIVAQGHDRCWFRHPLLADVLYGTFAPGEAEPVHAAWARTLELCSLPGLEEVRRQGDLALHYGAAHDLESCLKASLRAAELAQEMKTLREEALHLRRAARLWPQVHRNDADQATREVDLLERAAYVSRLIGDGEASLAACDRALELVDEPEEPLRASRLLLQSAGTRWDMGEEVVLSTSGTMRAVELSRAFPDSEEYATALADLGRLQARHKLEPARRNADEAVRAAHRSGSVHALATAYRCRGLAYLEDNRSDHDTAEALRFAELTGDPQKRWSGLLARLNYLYLRGRVLEAVQITAEFLPTAMRIGAQAIGVSAAGNLARDLLLLGRWSEAAEMIREGLSVSGLPSASALVRLSAAALALRQGSAEVAGMHLKRADELLPALADRVGMPAPPHLAEYLLAHGQAEEALDLLTRTMTSHPNSETRLVDEMLMWGARAAADLMESARDWRDGNAVRNARARFDELVAARNGLQQPPPFTVIEAGDLVQPAMEALYTAERARLTAEPATSTAWDEATCRCGAAGMRWEEAIASWRWAQALLHEGAPQLVVAARLRAAYRFVVEVSAMPLRQQIESLATIGRIRLDEPVEPKPQDQPPSPFCSLTRREREVLSHLVAGRTYAEIAGALFISEKTVSAHVSNLLRKTGTSSSLEVSALAVRLSGSARR